MKVDFVKLNIKDRRTVIDNNKKRWSEYLKSCEWCKIDFWTRKSKTRFCCHTCAGNTLRVIHDPLEHFFREKITRNRGNAKKREIDFSITWEDLKMQYEKQKGKCFYTGLEMSLTYSSKTHLVCPPEQLSVDRVDPKKGYTKDNIVLCCYCINNFKGDSDLETFNKFCDALINIRRNNET